jgi:predicted nucleic acid-binding protein
MVLLDTDVLSLTSPASRIDEMQVRDWRAWVRENAHLLHFSVVTLMEVRFGIEKLASRGASRKAEELRKWLAVTETMHAARLLPVTARIAHKAGELLHVAVSAGVTPSTEDALIAATAHCHGFRLLSRNLRHMSAFGVDVADPLAIAGRSG